MKAVVMQKENKTCAVLCADGSFRRINGNFDVGEKINVILDGAELCRIKGSIRKKKKSLFKTILPYAAAAMLILLGGGVYYETAYAYSYVTIDVNPSIELTLNRLGRVIDITALNEDAEDIVDSLSSEIKFSAASEAVAKTIEVLQENNYLVDDTSSMLIDVVSENEEVAADLSKLITASVKEHGGIDSVILTSDTNMRKEAVNSGLSTGRYEAMKEASERYKEVEKAADYNSTREYENVSENKAENEPIQMPKEAPEDSQTLEKEQIHDNEAAVKPSDEIIEEYKDKPVKEINSDISRPATDNSDPVSKDASHATQTPQGSLGK